jgi:hypothetical protein
MLPRSALIIVNVVIVSACTSSRPPETRDFAVNGIALGSPATAALRVFGVPTESRDGVDDEFGRGEWQEFVYAGLIVGTSKPAAPFVKTPASHAYVSELSLRDPKWAFANGIRPGISRSAVVRALGEPELANSEEDREVLYYSFLDFDATLRVVVVSGVVVEVSIAESWS